MITVKDAREQIAYSQTILAGAQEQLKKALLDLIGAKMKKGHWDALQAIHEGRSRTRGIDYLRSNELITEGVGGSARKGLVTLTRNGIELLRRRSDFPEG